MATGVFAQRPQGVAVELGRLMASGYSFLFPDLDGTLRHLLDK